MSPHEARRFLIAAQDDPVIAAWVVVLHEHRAASPTDVSPYEAWDALQALHDAGVVPTHDFDDLQGRFFDHLPSRDRLEAALTSLRILPTEDAPDPRPQGDSMFKKSKDSNALERVSPQEDRVTSAPVKAPLSSPVVRQPLSRPGSTPPGVPGRSARAPLTPPPAAPTGSSLPCVDDPASISLKTDLPCPARGCLGMVTPMDLGAVGIAEDGIAALGDSGEVRLYHSMYGLECRECGLIQQSLVGKMPR